MKTISEKCLQEFVAGARRIAEHGLVLCGSGNLSWRVDDEHMLITTTDSWMSTMAKDQIAVCRVADSAILNGKEPSKEIGFHAAILRERSDVNVVLHFQSPYATTLSCRERQVEDFSVIPEMPYYIGPVAWVPYLTPGSHQLASAVTSAMKEHDLAILRNHGLVAVGKTFDEVIAKAAFFELACKIILHAGEQLQFLSKEAIAELRQKGKASRTHRSTPPTI